MYKQYCQLMYLERDGDWKTLRDESGKRFEFHSPDAAMTVAGAMNEVQVIASLVVKVEEAQVYHPITRQMFIHTTYTGMKSSHEREGYSS